MNIASNGARYVKSLLAGIRKGASTYNLTRDHVIWAYRLILEREPESEEAIINRIIQYSTIKQLRSEFLSTPEYRLKNPDASPFASKRNIVIKEIDDKLRLFIDLSDVVIGMNILQESFERGELQFVKSHVGTGQMVIDLGANIGFFTIHLASLVGSSGKVYAFEPLPRNADLIERSVSENGFKDRVTLERVAVGDAAGESTLFYEINSMHSGGSYLVDGNKELPEGHALLQVPIVPLDQIALRRPIDFIKMDIEGSEPLALRGAEEILAHDRPIIMAELNPDLYPVVSKCTPNEFLSEMAVRGYKCYRLQDGKIGQQIFQVEELCTGVFLPGD